MVSTDHADGLPVARLALALAQHPAAAPPGIDSVAFGRACLSDTYEVLAGLTSVTAGIVTAAAALDREAAEDLLWPGSVHVAATDIGEVLSWWSTPDRSGPPAGDGAALVLVPGDVPDLPALVPAKVFQALARADVAVAPESGGRGCAALGFRWPVPGYVTAVARDLRLDADPYEWLAERAPRRNLVVRTPGWRRLREPVDVSRLDPGLEGWEETRFLLAARPLG